MALQRVELTAVGISTLISDLAFTPILGTANSLLPIIGFSLSARLWPRLWGAVKINTRMEGGAYGDGNFRLMSLEWVWTALLVSDFNGFVIAAAWLCRAYQNGKWSMAGEPNSR